MRPSPAFARGVVYGLCFAAVIWTVIVVVLTWTL